MSSNMVEWYIARRSNVLPSVRAFFSGVPTTGTLSRKLRTLSLASKYAVVVRRWVRYRASAPTLWEMDILLSFRITSRLSKEPMLFMPS